LARFGSKLGTTLAAEVHRREPEECATLIERQSPSLTARPAPAERTAGEQPGATLRRWALGLLWSLKPPRLYGIPATLLMLARHYAGLGLSPGALPNPDRALTNPDGLAGICTDLSVPALAAYGKGLFPFAEMVGAGATHGLPAARYPCLEDRAPAAPPQAIRGDVRYCVRRGDQAPNRVPAARD
jgi:hypothetical protein